MSTNDKNDGCLEAFLMLLIFAVFAFFVLTIHDRVLTLEELHGISVPEGQEEK